MKTAIIGLGAMGRRHVAAVERATTLTLVAAADIRSKAFDSAGLPENVARFEASAALFQSVRPELVIVATTAPSHRELVEAAVAAGAQAVLCEKPIACSLSDARAMLDCCQSAGVTLAVSHVRRHVPAYRWLAERIASGDWGQLRGIRVSVPGIGLGCLGTHFVDLMLFLADRSLVSVAGWVDQPLGQNPRGSEFIDPGGTMVGETSDGARMYLQQIEDGAGPHLISIDLTGARVVVDEWTRDVEVLVRDRSVQNGPVRPPGFKREELPVDRPLDLDIVQLVTAALDELAAGARPTCAAIHGYRSLEAVVATYVSHERGHVPMSLPLESSAVQKRNLKIT